MVLVNVGQFSMTLPDNDHNANNSEEYAPYVTKISYDYATITIDI